MRKMLRRLAVLALVAPLSCLVLPAFGQDFEEEEPEEVMGEEELVEPIEEAGDEETGDDVFLDLEGEEEEPTPEEIAEDFETDKALEAQMAAKSAYTEAERAVSNGDYELAVAKLKEALALAPDEAEYLERLEDVQKGYIYELLKKNEFAETIVQADDFLARFKDPEDPNVEAVKNFREEATKLLGAQPAEEMEVAVTVEEGPKGAPVLKTRGDEELLADAIRAYRLKDYDLAKDLLLEAREINKYNVEVDRWLDRVYYQVYLHERSIRETTRQELINQVMVAWNDRPARPVFEPGGPLPTPEGPEETPARKIIIQKLETIIPVVDFKDAELKEVIEFLAREANVNIVIDPIVFQTVGTTLEVGPPEETPLETPFEGPPVAPETEFPTMPEEGAFGGSEFAPQGGGLPPYDTGGGSGPPPPDFGGFEPEFPGPDVGIATPPPVGGYGPPQSTKITIHLEDVPLKYVLRYVLRYKNLKYVVEDYAILIIPIDYVLPEELETEIFRLSTSGVGTSTGAIAPGGFRGGGSDEFGGDFGSFGEGFEEEGGTGEPENIEDWLKRAGGVTWPRGSNIVYHRPTATLIVTNTPTNMVLIRELIKIWDRPPMQVEVEARFVEMQYNRAFENSFVAGMTDYLRWTRNEGAGWGTLPLSSRERIEMLVDPSSTLRVSAASPILDIKGILTRPEFRVIWYALEQNDYADLLSAPRVTTISGQQALIQIVQEIRYPTEYETEALEEVAYVLSDFGAFYVTPGTFETREVGIRLNVTPTVSADGEVITLVLLPEVSDLVAWINYGTELIPAWQPTFESRDVTTTVYINDGETLVLGGVIQDNITTIRDRVPILGSIPLVGRLFRSEYETIDKSNLVIFVSADLITSRGTRVKQEREIKQQRERFLERYREQLEASEREAMSLPEGM